MSVAALAFLASACRGSDVVEPQSPGSGFSLEEFAGILSALPMDRSHLGEVFDAVCASSENGYDEEYMLADLVGSPGAGVGDGVFRSKAAPRYDRPLRDLLSDYFEANPSAVPTRAGSSEACLRMLEESDMQIYWPYSEDWDGEAFPIITFDPGDGSEYNYGYQAVRGEDGSVEIQSVYVDEQVAMSRPVWVINNNDDSHLVPVQSAFLDDAGAAALRADASSPEVRASSGVQALIPGVRTAIADAAASVQGSDGDVPGERLYIRSLKMLRNYDSWFGGASEFVIKCGAVDGFRATSEEDLSKYRPSVTDCVVVVKRRQLGMSVPLGILLLTDYTPQMENIAFLVTEDDGGKVENWKCEATVKWQSKSYGFTLNIPYRDRDDIVWRGQLSRSFFERGSIVTDRFGDVEITFERR
ncbi:MAG: hypothetical protein BHV78_06785 [Bacteroides sp. CAG:1060_57_27]|nr:MAG: hypothetical protein BHV78_06785 [Bacteroides sp. CAG:1060_57_27]